MGKYDGPSFYKKDHRKAESMNGKRQAKPLSKYELPNTVRTRDDLQKEVHQYMETPSYLNGRFRSTKIPTSLQHLDGWKHSRRNYRLIEEISKRLTVESSDYLLFDEYLKEEPERVPKLALDLRLEPEPENEPSKDEAAETKAEPKVEPENPIPDSSSSAKDVTLSKEDLVDLQLGQKKPMKKKAVHKKVEVVQEKMAAQKRRPSSGLHRSLSNIIADDKKAMKQWNSSLNNLFSDEKMNN